MVDNKMPNEVKTFIASKNAALQYTTPPDMHQVNPAKIAIQIWKSCMESTLVSLPLTFPIIYWHWLCDKVDSSVNIIHKWQQNPLLSAWVVI